CPTSKNPVVVSGNVPEVNVEENSVTWWFALGVCIAAEPTAGDGSGIGKKPKLNSPDSVYTGPKISAALVTSPCASVIPPETNPKRKVLSAAPQLWPEIADGTDPMLGSIGLSAWRVTGAKKARCVPIAG